MRREPSDWDADEYGPWRGPPPGVRHHDKRRSQGVQAERDEMRQEDHEPNAPGPA